MNAIKRLWSWFWGPAGAISLGLLLILGFVGGILFWGGFHTAMEMTNTEDFCVSCHEMEANVYAEYSGSVHDTNASGVRATCPDCHVPRDWRHKMVRKIRASNEVWHWLWGTIDTREKFEAKRIHLASNVWRTMKETDSRECRNCHDFRSMDLALQPKRARTQHARAADDGSTCIDCHKGIAHELPAGAPGIQPELTVSWDEG
jgi:cytochrome c-type protein NapC